MEVNFCSLFGGNFFWVFGLDFGSHKHTWNAAFIIEFLDLVEPGETVFETVLVGRVVDDHDEVGIFADSHGDGLIEVMTAEVEQEQFYVDVLFWERDYFGVDLGACSLPLFSKRTMW